MLRALADSDQRWRLSIVGDGPERDRLQLLARDLGVESRVTWHGLVPNAGRLFAAFDAFVLSSRTEGTPISLLEAMHAEVPIVATRVGGVPDVVASEHAVLVASERPAEIARALHAIDQEPSAARQRSSRAKQRLITEFSAASWLETVEATYKAAVSSAQSH
jgi:glycosyltransferase involved in cell wall biosynthesis